MINYVAEAKVAELLEELEEIMDDHDLDFEDIRDTNTYGYFAQEPGQAVDVWEVRLTGCWKVYFLVDVSEE